MLTRLFVDNYKALVNFELELPQRSLFLGLNGTGKTSVFEVVDVLKQLMLGATLHVPTATLTRWQALDRQKFEIDATLEGHAYRYSLEVEHSREIEECRITSERLILQGRQTLFESDTGKAQLYRDDGSKGPEVLAERSRSSLPVVAGRRDNRKLTRFVEWLSRDVLICAIHPALMRSLTDGSAMTLATDLSNFAAWWRRFQDEDSRAPTDLRRFLEPSLPGFHGLEFQAIGESDKIKRLRVRIDDMSFGFEELSDGQRVLIALYALLVYSKKRPVTLLLDEGDNFVAVREIQPFYNAIEASEGAQAALISHHPTITDLMAIGSGILFTRGVNAPVRVERFKAPSEAGLTASELFAKGFFDEPA